MDILLSSSSESYLTTVTSARQLIYAYNLIAVKIIVSLRNAISSYGIDFFPLPSSRLATSLRCFQGQADIVQAGFAAFVSRSN